MSKVYRFPYCAASGRTRQGVDCWLLTSIQVRFYFNHVKLEFWPSEGSDNIHVSCVFTLKLHWLFRNYQCFVSMDYYVFCLLKYKLNSDWPVCGWHHDIIKRLCTVRCCIQAGIHFIWASHQYLEFLFLARVSRFLPWVAALLYYVPSLDQFYITKFVKHGDVTLATASTDYLAGRGRTK